MCLAAAVVVVEVDRRAGTARVDGGGHERIVSLALHPEVRVGDRVTVHTGFVVDVTAEPPPVAGRRVEGDVP
jgi:hydrogenase maturation factor